MDERDIVLNSVLEHDRLFVWLDYFLPIYSLNCGIISYPHIGFIVRCTVQFSKNQSL